MLAVSGALAGGEGGCAGGEGGGVGVGCSATFSGACACVAAWAGGCGSAARPQEDNSKTLSPRASVGRAGQEPRRRKDKARMRKKALCSAKRSSVLKWIVENLPNVRNGPPSNSSISVDRFAEPAYG